MEPQSPAARGPPERQRKQPQRSKPMQDRHAIPMIIAARQMMDTRRGSTTIVFAAFAAILTLGVMMLGRSAGQQMFASLNKAPAIRY